MKSAYCWSHSCLKLKTVLVPLDYAALLPDAAAGAGAVCKVEFYASNIESGAERDHETWAQLVTFIVSEKDF